VRRYEIAVEELAFDELLTIKGERTSHIYALSD